MRWGKLREVEPRPSPLSPRAPINLTHPYREGAVIEAVNECEAGNSLLIEAIQEGWLRHQEKDAKPPQRAQTG